MTSIVALLYAISSLILAVAAAINAVAKFKTVATKKAIEAQTQSAGFKIGVSRTDLFFFIMGASGMGVGIGMMVWMLNQPDGPATRHQVIDVGLCLVNIVMGNLILVTTTIKKYVA